MVTSARTSGVYLGHRFFHCLCVSIVLAGCTGTEAAQTQATAQNTDTLPAFVVHPEHIIPGFPGTPNALPLTNPYPNDARAVKLGAQLFVSYNCIDCHGADGSGAMGPSLADGRFHFGGEPAEIFESIYEGRPEGMPAWGGRIANDQIWMLAAYVRSLNAGKDVSTENFSGKTVERTGH